MAATLSQMERAMVNAHKAGDTDAARKLAAVVNRERRRLAADPLGAEMESLDAAQYGEEPVGETIAQQPDPTLGQKITGALETGATLGTAMTGGLLGQIEGSVEGIIREIASGEFGSNDSADRVEQLAMERAQQFTYEPTTETGQEYAKVTGEALAPLAAIPALAETQVLANMSRLTPKRQMLRESVSDPTKQAAAEIVKRVKERLPEKAPIVDDKSMGASSVTAPVIRQAQADELPVPIKLTEGQKTRSFEAQRFERETAKDPEAGAPIRERFEDQNRQLQQNMDAFIDQTGSEISDVRGVGELVNQALRNRAARDKTKIKTLYKEAEKAGEMQEPVSMKNVADFLNESSSSESTAPILSVAKKELARLGGATIDKDGSIVIGSKQVKDVASPFTGQRRKVESGGEQTLTLNQAEQLRKVINKNAGNDPTNIKFASELKQIIDETTEGLGGDSYKKARAARAKYSKDYENISLVKNLMGTKRGSSDRSIALEDVVRKSILDPSTSLDTTRQLRRLLQTKDSGEGTQAWKELQGATLRHIQEQMTKGVTTNSRGDRVVSTQQLEKIISQLDKSGKLDFIFGKKGAEQLRTLNEVAKTVLTAPPGVVNHSNTASVLAAFMDVALTGATGVPAPVATSFRLLTDRIKDAKLKARIKKTLGE